MRSHATQNYLLSTKLTFLMFSFILLVIAVTVHHDIWPFLLEYLPSPPKHHSYWAISGIIIGIILPSLWLWRDWSEPSVRYSLISLISMLMLQVLTEVTVSRYFFISMVVPTAILYTGYRLVQLICLQRIVYRLNYSSTVMKTSRMLVIVGNLVFWSFLWIKMTFFVFPGIIPDAF